MLRFVARRCAPRGCTAAAGLLFCQRVGLWVQRSPILGSHPCWGAWRRALALLHSTSAQRPYFRLAVPHWVAQEGAVLAAEARPLWGEMWHQRHTVWDSSALCGAEGEEGAAWRWRAEAGAPRRGSGLAHGALVGHLSVCHPTLLDPEHRLTVPRAQHCLQLWWILVVERQKVPRHVTHPRVSIPRKEQGGVYSAAGGGGGLQPGWLRCPLPISAIASLRPQAGTQRLCCVSRMSSDFPCQPWAVA